MANTHSTPGARFVDPRVLARIGNLKLLARSVVDGFINGLHKAPYLGVSVDFAEHRGYMPGDDIRFIDWRVFARTDRFYVKQFEADLQAAGKSADITVCEGVDHAFFNDTRDAVYDPAHASTCWSRMLGFYREHVR